MGKISVGPQDGGRRIPWLAGLFLAPLLVVWMSLLMLFTFVAKLNQDPLHRNRNIRVMVTVREELNQEQLKQLQEHDL
jgi:hypothetical protein